MGFVSRVLKIGVLAFQGSVIEHINATRAAAINLKIADKCEIIEVRTKQDLETLDALIIPGGESTVFYKLCEREGMLEAMRKVPCIFGTCAGAIFLAKKITGGEESGGQKTLSLMDIEIDRNAYGRQSESFEKEIITELLAATQTINAVFIRAPKIRSVGNAVNVLAKNGKDILACEQQFTQNKKHYFYLAVCFHPELTTAIFHEHFLKNLTTKF